MRNYKTYIKILVYYFYETLYYKIYIIIKKLYFQAENKNKKTNTWM